MANKKNQHYIPKFYLRNFSFENDKKQIGIFNIANKYFYQKATLKNQGSRNFFYGNDGDVEDKLAKIEGIISRIILQIIDSEEIPKVNSDDYFNLCLFIVLTDLRNPVRVEIMKGKLEVMKEELLKTDSSINLDKFMPTPSHEKIVKALLSNTLEMTNSITDLQCKLLINRTNIPFIASDYPVIKYNQFLEMHKWEHSKIGYETVGLQIFVPLNSKLTLLLFDSNIYKVGDKKKNYLEIKNELDINKLNILQFINCFETLFFDEKVKEHYMRKLFNDSRRFNKANLARANMGFIVQDDEDENEVLNNGQNLIVLSASECESNLRIDGIKIQSKGKKYNFKPSVLQSRN